MVLAASSSAGRRLARRWQFAAILLPAVAMVSGMGLASGAPAASAASAQSVVAPAAQAALAKAKEAAGGAAWDAVKTQHARVRIETSGLTGTADAFDDVLTGRHFDTFKLGPFGGAEGWDGEAGWEVDPSGQSKRMEGGDENLGAVDEAYRRCLAYWYPDRWPAEIADGGVRQDGGRSFQVVTITPRGGRAFEIWLDTTTWLTDRLVEQTAMATRTTFLSDYRVVDGRKVAFGSRTTNGETKYDQTVVLESVEYNVPVDEARFRMPGPPPADFAFAGGKTSVTVPFELVNNHIYLDVMLNGRGPFSFLCDTGGANVITPTIAKQLGVESQGALQGRGVGEKSEDVGLVQLDSLAIGGVTIRKQLFAVFALESYAEVEGRPMPGLVGYEVFKRFVVRVDYERGLLTLTLPSAFTYQGAGTSVPFRFNDHIPQIDGSIDGIAGKFDIDTGSRASLSLLRPFAEKNDLANKMPTRYEAVTGWGVGGPARGRIARAKELRLGDVSIAAPVVELSQQQKGAFSDPYVAGNVGAGVLKRFNVTFDYEGKRIIFEPNAAYGRPDVYDRSGMWINAGDPGLKVMDVTAGGPAEAAGLKTGDLIVAIDGAPVGPASLVSLRARFRSDAPGTKVSLTVETGGARRQVVLALRDLV